MSNSTSFLLILFLVLFNSESFAHRVPGSRSKIPSINMEKVTPDSCIDLSLPGIDGVTEIGEILNPKDCNKICYDNYQVLPETYRINSYLAFPNPGYRGIGRCRGHAIVTQQFSMLGRFGQGSNPDKCGPQNMSTVCTAFYKNIIDDIRTGKKVRDIPGFSSLLEFSSTSPLKDILYKNVISFDYRFSAGEGHVESNEGNRDTNVFREIFKRGRNNQKPYVGIKTTSGGDHAVLVTGVKYLNDVQVLCVSDPNEKDYDTYQNPSCEVYIGMTDGKPYYHTTSGRVGLKKLNIYSDEDERTAGYVDAWKDRCINEKTADGDCKRDPFIAGPE